MEYFNKTQTDWRISQCCQFDNKLLAKRYNLGTTTKTYALKDGGKERVQQKALANVAKLRDVLTTYFPTQPRNLRSFRISSELFPCYTLDFTKDWYAEIWPEISKIMAQAGEAAKQHEIRVSTHPAQFTVLASNRPDVVANSVKDLEYHALYGELMGLEAKDFSMNIHLQGLYGGLREDGIKRFATHFHYLSDYAQQSLSVENEDKHKSGYDITHVLELCAKIPTRATFDIHHFECFHQKECEYVSANNWFFKDAVKTWGTSRPLFHVSQTIIDEDGNDGRMNAHSYKFHDRDRLAMLVPLLEFADFDIEAKGKEVAVNDAYNFILEEENYAGEKLVCR
jgi:UV DNA damage endonuclease